MWDEGRSPKWILNEQKGKLQWQEWPKPPAEHSSCYSLFFSGLFGGLERTLNSLKETFIETSKEDVDDEWSEDIESQSSSFVRFA